MGTIKKWWAAHPLSMHAVVAFVTAVTTLYEFVPAFHKLLLTVYGALPSWSHQVVAAAIGIYAYYYKSGKPTPPPVQ